MTFWIPRQSKTDPMAFTLTTTPAACVGPPERQFFMGGAAMACAVEALETATGRPLLWATMHFISQTGCDAEIDIAVETPIRGRNVSQATATLSEDGRVLQQVAASLGGREGFPDVQFLTMPDVPSPAECPEKEEDVFGEPGNLLDQFERRTAFQDDDKGIEFLWMRLKADHPPSAGLLALMADFFLGAHTMTRGGTSLDNLFRLHALPKSQWVLNVVQLTSFGRGAAHGTMSQFDQDGTLLSTAGQTGMLPRR